MSTPRPSRCRVLIVDDEPAILREFVAALQPDSAYLGVRQELAALESALFGQPEATAAVEDYDPVTCRQGDEAVELVRTACLQGFPFAVAFIDIQLPPGRDGVEVARSIRALDPLINIVMVTGFSDHQPASIAAVVPPQDKILFLKKPLYADEIRQLASALGAKWKAEKGRLEAYANLEELVQSRTRALQRANADLARLKRIRRDLYGAISCELGVPVEMIRREADAARGRPEADPRILLAALDHIGDRARQLGSLLEDLASMADVGTIALTAHNEKIPILRLLHELSGDFHILASDKGCRVSVTGPRDGLQVEGNPQRLKTLLLLLVDYAIRHAGQGGQVTVTLSPDDSDVNVVFSWRASALDASSVDPPESSPAAAPVAQLEGPFFLAGAIADAHSGRIALVADGPNMRLSLRLPRVPATWLKGDKALH